MERGEVRTGISSKHLDAGTLSTKWVFDSIILALAVGVIASAGIDKPLLTVCESVETKNSLALDPGVLDGLRGSDCETLNFYRVAVLAGGLAFLTPTLMTTVDFAWVTKKALLDKGVVRYFKGTDRLFHSMFSLMSGEFNTYNAFVLRVPVAFVNWIKFLISPLRMPFQKNPGVEVIHYFLSLPALCTPVVLVTLLYVLVRDAGSPVECFSYAAALQIYALLGNLLAGAIYNREVSVGSLVGSFTSSPGTNEDLLDAVATRLGRVAGTKKWAVIEYPPGDHAGYLGYSERDYLEAVLDAVTAMDVVLRIRFVNFRGARIVDVVRLISRRLPRQSEMHFDARTLFTEQHWNDLSTEYVTVTHDNA